MQACSLWLRLLFLLIYSIIFHVTLCVAGWHTSLAVSFSSSSILHRVIGEKNMQYSSKETCDPHLQKKLNVLNASHLLSRVHAEKNGAVPQNICLFQCCMASQSASEFDLTGRKGLILHSDRAVRSQDSDAQLPLPVQSLLVPLLHQRRLKGGDHCHLNTEIDLVIY